MTNLRAVPHDDAVERLMVTALEAAATAWDREEEGNGSLAAGEESAIKAASAVLQNAIRQEALRTAVAHGLAMLARRQQEDEKPGW